jgi:outer membrane lipoprotein
MGEGDRKVSFEALRSNPDVHKGRLFILGGVIVRAQFTEAGSRLEAVHVPVDSYGYFEDRGRSEGRFIALALKDGPSLDPVVYSRGRRVTVAAEFIEAQKGKIDDMEYMFPVFLILQIFLWP